MFTFDGEYRLNGANIGNRGPVTYIYDAEGRRVEKTSSTLTEIYALDTNGNTLAEYSNQTQPFNGTEYLTADHIGNTRLIMNSLGQVVRRYDYLRFGEEIPSGQDGRGSGYGAAVYPTTPDNVNHKFTGKERDAESGLDYFGARYMASAQGRFASPDSATGSPSDPQSWNSYPYVRINPLLFTDPDGQTYQICGSSGNCYDNYSNADFDKN